MSYEYRSLLALHGEGHWWTAGMRRIAGVLSDPPHGRVLDVGCGPGWDLVELPEGVRGIGLDQSAEHVFFRPLVLGRAARLPFAAAIFDTVYALDLLDQRDVEPPAALEEIRRVLRPGGTVVVRVPAYAWLRGPHDEYWGGERRFSRSQLEILVRNARLEPERLTYANTLPFPAAMMSRLLGRAGVISGNDLGTLPEPVNKALFKALDLESRWLRRHNLPFGLSLLCVALRVEP